jgi:hypothetical protein
VLLVLCSSLALLLRAVGLVVANCEVAQEQAGLDDGERKTTGRPAARHAEAQVGRVVGEGRDPSQAAYVQLATVPGV